MATLAAVTTMPALAVLAEDGTLERSTEPFRRWYADKEELCRASPELQRVLEGQANAAVLKLDDIVVDIVAMSDRTGGRHVLLTLPTEDLPSLGDVGGALLDGALDESPALVWLKDLDGRYVRVNARFTTLLDTSEERLLGRTDADLPPAETVDGPRLQDREEGYEEPLQLEYMVPPFQGREALVVLRFPVGDRKGVPTLVCGVAAPSSQAGVARAEAARLLRVERWSRLDPESVRAELLADWDLLPDARGRSAVAAPGHESAGGASDPEREAAVAEARAERATAVAERDAALHANETLAADLRAAQARLSELERALKEVQADGERSDAEAALATQAAELERALTRERERAEELDRTLSLVRERLGDDAEAARVEVQRARADAEAARTEVQRARADAEAARADLEKARAEADAARTTAANERESATKTRAELEREVQQARARLADLERRHGADDSSAQLLAADKARASSEAAVASAVAERDAALKARVVLEGELGQERQQVVALRESSAAAEERIRDLAAGMERERVRAEGLGQVQARAQELERELRTAAMRADKAEVELELAAGRAEKAETALETAAARVDKADAELRAAAMRADKAEVEAEQWQGRVKRAESELERGRSRIDELEDKLAVGRGRIDELEAEVKAGKTRVDELEGEVRAGRGRIAEVERQVEVGQGRIGALEAEVRVGQALIDELEGQLEAGRVRVDELEGELEAGRVRVEELEGELEAGRVRVEELEGELEAGRVRVDELEGELEAGQVRVEGLEGELEAGRARIDELEDEVESARATAEKTESASAEAADVELEAPAQEAATEAASVLPEPSEARTAADEPAVSTASELATLDAVQHGTPAAIAGGVSWQPTAKRTLSASLARESVWRNVLKETVQVLGAEGGWDTVTAWLPDESNDLGCAATWIAHRGLDRFEALTWEASVGRDGSLLDQALQAPHLTWLTDIDAVDDERLQTASAHGMSSALLLPVRNGNTTIGLLELLTHDSIEPDAQIALSLEAAALQLGRFGHLLSLGGKRS